MLLDIADSILVPGAVGIIPTDTVYGLIARAKDRKAVKRLYGLKDRQSKPGTVVAANIEQLIDLGLKRKYLMAVKDYWPGPLSVIIPCGDGLKYLHLGRSGLAVRLPDKDELRELLIKAGPLLTSSANLPGQSTAITINEAKEYFKDKVDFYVDGVNLADRQPSTIIRIVDDATEVIRQGSYKLS